MKPGAWRKSRRNSLALGKQLPMSLLGLARFFDKSTGARRKRQYGCLAQPDKLGHVDRVLDDVGDFAVRPDDRRMRRGPIAHVEPAALAGCTRNVVRYEGESIRLGGIDYALEGRPKPLTAFAVIGKEFEEVSPDELVRLPA